MRRTGFILAISLLLASLPAAAGTKEQLIQLQATVDQLQLQMTQMKQSLDERMGVMRNLVEQSSDNVNKLSNGLAALDKKLSQQTADSSEKTEQISSQVQAMHDSVDELKARMAKISKQLDDMMSAQQNLQSTQQQVIQQQHAPPADMLYSGGLRDYNAAKYDLAQQEFADYLKYYPNGDLAGNAQFYLADIQFRMGKFDVAVKEYDKVVEQYPGNNKVPAAQLKKGFALLELGQTDAGVDELQSLLERYPKAPEAVPAKDRLRKLGMIKKK